MYHARHQHRSKLLDMTVSESPRNIVDTKNSSSLDTLYLTEEKVIKEEIKENEGKEIVLRELPKQKKITLVMLATAYLCTQASYSLLAPFFPREAAKKNVSAGMVGFIFSTFELVVFLTSFVYGHVMTRVGAKFMCIAGMGVCGSCAILFGILDRCPAGSVFIALAILTRSLEGLGASAFMTSTYAITGYTFTEYLSMATAILEACNGIGITLGPPLGGVLYEVGGYGLPFWVLGSVIILTIPFAVILLPNDVDNKNKDMPSSLRMFKSPLVLISALNMTIGSFSFSFFFPSLAQHIAKFGLTPITTGLMFMITPAAYAIFGPFIGWLLDKTQAILPGLLISNVVTFLGLLLLGPCPIFDMPESIGQVGAALLVLGISGGAIILVAMRGLFVGAAEMGYEDNMDTYGIVSGFLTCSLSLGAFLGPLLGGILQQHFGFGWQTTAGSLIFVFITPICCILLSYRKCAARKDYVCPKTMTEKDEELQPIYPKDKFTL